MTSQWNSKTKIYKSNHVKSLYTKELMKTNKHKLAKEAVDMPGITKTRLSLYVDYYLTIMRTRNF